MNEDPAGLVACPHCQVLLAPDDVSFPAADGSVVCAECVTEIAVEVSAAENDDPDSDLPTLDVD